MNGAISPSALPTQAQIRLSMGMSKSLAWAGVGQNPGASRHIKHRAEQWQGFAQVLPMPNYLGTAWACPSTVPILISLPTFVLGHAQAVASPTNCLGMLNWACSIHSHTQLHAQCSSLPVHVARWGECKTLEPTGMWQPSSSRFGAHYLLLTGMVCGRWQQQHSRPDDVN